MAISTLFTQFGIGSKLLTIFLRLFLIINFLITTTPNWDANRDGRIDGSDVTASASGNSATTTPSGHSHTQHSPAFAQRRRAGFVRYDEPPEQPQSRTDFALGGPTVPAPTVTTETLWNSVPQRSDPEQPTQNSRTAPVPSVRATGVLADIKYWEKLSCLYLKRSHTSQREKYRQDNASRYEAYRTMLEALGVRVERGAGLAVTFNHPDKYDTSDAAMRIVEAQYTILRNLKNGTPEKETEV